MSRSYAVVIIGGGVIGTSVAWHLAQRGCSDVLIVEQNQIGSGSTAKAAGGIRQQFSSATNIAIGRYGVDFYADFQARLGLDPDESGANFKQVGYLFLLTDDADMATFRANADLQQRMGVPVEILSRADVAARYPYLYTDDVIGATYCPTDGYASNSDVVAAFAKQARRRGVQIWEETAVRGIRHDGSRIVAVETDRGTVSAGAVVCCAGAWSGEIGAMVGTNIPVYGVKRQAFFTAPFDALPDTLPFVIDMGSGFHFRREGPGFLLGESDPAQAPGYDTTLDWNWLDTVIEHALYRVPAFENARILSGWAGLYDTSPDHNGIVGAVPGFTNFYLASGFSGHGFMQSPAVGNAIAEMIVDGASTTIDVADLSIERFRDPVARHERNII